MKQTAVEWLIEQVALNEHEEGFFLHTFLSNEEISKAKDMQEEQMIDFANWCRIHDSYHKNEVWMIGQLYTKYLKEKYGSND